MTRFILILVLSVLISACGPDFDNDYQYEAQQCPDRAYLAVCEGIVIEPIDDLTKTDFLLCRCPE